MTRGRKVKECGAIGTKEIASIVGARTGPPALKAYAVEPVGVAITTPSQTIEETILFSILTSI